MNIFQLIQSAKNGNINPLMGMLQQQSGSNPVFGNVFRMLQSGDGKGIEQIARNLANERGIDADKAVQQLKQQTGL